MKKRVNKKKVYMHVLAAPLHIFYWIGAWVIIMTAWTNNKLEEVVITEN